MANQSIYNAFERMWQHIVTKYITKENPTGIGSFSLNRKADTTIGEYSFSEGINTTASGVASHAEGYNTTASGDKSHAEGMLTIATTEAQHVQGKFNIEDVNYKYAHIVGNGTENVRSNAHTLDWDGNAWFAGDVYVGSTSGTNEDEGSKKLATENYVMAPKSELILIDKITGENYIVCIENGNLVSYKAE
jgi:hypothetical protein